MFQVKFQFQIRQKCRSKWNVIGHALELGSISYLILSASTLTTDNPENLVIPDY